MAKERTDIAAYLGAGTVYNGKLNFVGEVQINGQFTGEIKSEGLLVIGKDAKVEGVIEVSALALSGNLHGDVVVTGKTELHKTANFTGTLTTKALVMEEGALLQGNICMDPSQTSLGKANLAKADIAKDEIRDVDLQ